MRPRLVTLSLQGSRPFVVVPTGPNPAVALLGGGAKDLEKYNNTDDFRKPGKLVVLDGRGWTHAVGL